MKRIILACLLLSGCAGQEPRIVTKEVIKEVPVSCTPDVGPEPQYADNPAAVQVAPDIYEIMKLLLAGREQRIARDKVKSAAIGCPANGGR